MNVYKLKSILFVKLKEKNKRIYFQRYKLLIFDNNDLYFNIFIFIYSFFNIKHLEAVKKYEIVYRIYQ